MDEKIFMARVAEQAERFEDMVSFLKEMLKEKKGELSVEERNLLSVGFKNLIGSKRTAIRTIAAIEQNPKYQKFNDAMGNYKKKIEDELFAQCEDIVKTIKEMALPNANEGESKAFFLKMIGDYYRYIAENASGDRLKQVSDGALESYQQASEVCEKELGACNPTRLGLALNFSVFHFEVMNNNKKACELAEQALNDALAKIDECDEEQFRDAKSIIELLKENLSLWKEEEDGGEKGVEDL